MHSFHGTQWKRFINFLKQRKINSKVVLRFRKMLNVLIVLKWNKPRRSIWQTRLDCLLVSVVGQTELCPPYAIGKNFNRTDKRKKQYADSMVGSKPLVRPHKSTAERKKVYSKNKEKGHTPFFPKLHSWEGREGVWKFMVSKGRANVLHCELEYANMRVHVRTHVCIHTHTHTFRVNYIFTPVLK